MRFFLLVIASLSMNLFVTYAQSLSQIKNPSGATGNQDEQQLLQLTTSIGKQRYCSDTGSRFVQWTLNLTYTNAGNRSILLDKKSSWVYRSLVSRNLQAAAAKPYEYAPVGVYDDLDKLGFRAIPEPESFVVLEPRESFSLETQCRVHVYDGTKNTKDDLHPGNHILQVRVSTWYYYADPKGYRDKWIDRGYLWFENVTSEPMTFKIERQPKISPCSQNSNSEESHR